MAIAAKLEKPPKRIVNINGDTVFFPSSSETFDQGLLTGRKLAANEYCQECHPDSFHQWERSAHRFSSFNNPFYRKSVELMADRGRPRAHEVVLGVPRPGRPLHRADGSRHAGEVLLRLLGGAAGPHLHVLPLDRRGQGRPRERLLRHRGVEAVPVRVLTERDAPRDQPAPDPDGAVAPPEDVPESRSTDARVLLDLPQGRADPGPERLPLDARTEPLRHLVRLRRLGARGAILLRPAEGEGLPRLPPAAAPVGRVRKPRRIRPRPPLPGREHGASLHPEGHEDDPADAGLPPGQGALGRSVRDPAGRRDPARSASSSRK